MQGSSTPRPSLMRLPSRTGSSSSLAQAGGGGAGSGGALEAAPTATRAYRSAARIQSKPIPSQIASSAAISTSMTASTSSPSSQSSPGPQRQPPPTRQAQSPKGPGERMPRQPFRSSSSSHTLVARERSKSRHPQLIFTTDPTLDYELVELLGEG